MIGFIDSFFYNRCYNQNRLQELNNHLQPNTSSLITEDSSHSRSRSHSPADSLSDLSQSQSQTLQLAVYHQSVYIGDKPLETDD
jgi:hypothetical protein